EAEVRCNRKDKSVMWGQTTLTGVRGRDGKITFLIGMIEDVTDRKAQEAAIAHQAMHDALTDLPNRALLADRLHQAIRVAKRERHHLALLMMDLDHFKEVNDTFGHQAGDVLLRDVASRLRGELRGSDTVARLGGDEFALLLSRVETATPPPTSPASCCTRWTRPSWSRARPSTSAPRSGSRCIRSTAVTPTS